MKPLSDKILTIPKGLVCACGKCDLRNLKVKDVAEHIDNFEKRSLAEKIQVIGDTHSYQQGWNDAIVQLLAIHDEEFGDI